MFHVGMDYHKKYSIASAVDDQGGRVAECRFEGNTADGFRRFFENLGGPARVVIEACWNWGRLYDMIESIASVQEVVLAHPYKTRVIAEAQIKTDKIDARILAQLLRANLIPRAHIPDRQTRQKKDVLRQRLFWVKLRTRIRNRVHILLDRQKSLNRPQVSDIFGARGMAFLSEASLPEPDGTLLKQDLTVLKSLQEQIKQIEKQVVKENDGNEAVKLLLSVPGYGNILANVIAAEIDKIDRFRHSNKLCAYAGLVPTTYASGGKEYHGHLLPMCNKWLRWAFVEGAWVAVGCDPYFGALYKQQRDKGKNASQAIIVVARRMCQITWTILKEKRLYENRTYQTNSPGRSRYYLAVSN